MSINDTISSNATFLSANIPAAVVPSTLSDQDRAQLEIFLKSVERCLTLNDDDSRNSLTSLLANLCQSTNQPLKELLRPIQDCLQEYLNTKKDPSKVTTLVAAILRDMQ